MTPQERDLLSRFLDDLAHAQPAAKDPDAAAQIERALMSNRDAGYVLVQHAIVSDAALHDARQQAQALQQQVDELQRRLPSAAAAPAQAEPSFLGALFGRARSNDAPGLQGGGAQGGWGQGAAPAQAVPMTPQGYGSPAPYAQGASGPFSGGGGLGSFLKTAGTTAAGVAGGAFLIVGLSDVFGGGERRHEMMEDRQDFGGGDMGGDGGSFDQGDGGSGDDYS